MMFILRFFRDQDGSGGGGGDDKAGAGNADDKSGGGGSGEDKAGAGGADDKGGGSGSDDKSGTGKSGGAGGTGDKIDHKAELETANKKIAELTKGNDTMANKLGSLKKFQEAWETDPQKLIERIAKEGKLKVTFEDGAGKVPSIPEKLGDMDPDQQEDYLTRRDAALAAKVRGDIMSEVKGELQLTHEHRMKETYEDWDDHGDARQSLRMKHIAGGVPMDEILHNAVRGMNMPATLKAHEEVVREQVYKEIKEKTGGSHSGGGSKGDGEKRSGREFDLSVKDDISKLQSKYRKAKV